MSQDILTLKTQHYDCFELPIRRARWLLTRPPTQDEHRVNILLHVYSLVEYLRNCFCYQHTVKRLHKFQIRRDRDGICQIMTWPPWIWAYTIFITCLLYSRCAVPSNIRATPMVQNDMFSIRFLCIKYDILWINLKDVFQIQKLCKNYIHLIC